jgi:hypothetical protein
MLIPDIETIWKIAGLPKPQRETCFHPRRRWRIDYFWPEFKLAVEIQGGVFIKGRHVTGTGSVSDMEKFNHLTLCGIRLLCFTPRQVKSGYATAFIRALLRGETDPNLPPLPEKRKKTRPFRRPRWERTA